MGGNWSSAEGDPGGGEGEGGGTGRDNTYKATGFGGPAVDDGGGLFIIMTRELDWSLDVAIPVTWLVK